MQTSISTTDFDFIRTLVREQAAIVLDTGKEYLVESRLLPVASREGFSSLPHLVEALRTHSSTLSLQKKVIDAMTTNETSFYRDVEPFEVLKKNILPDLIVARKDVRQLNFWCAASSTGQEPYSVGILIREFFPQLATWDIRFTATDISSDVLEKAKRGRYNQMEVNRGLPATLLLKYFDKRGLEWQVKEPIRNMIGFQELNLIQSWPLAGPLDIVFMRNVLIYFDTDTKKRILQKIRGLMKRDGYLFLGGAETTLNLDDHFERMSFERAGCYKLKSN